MDSSAELTLAIETSNPGPGKTGLLSDRPSRAGVALGLIGNDGSILTLGVEPLAPSSRHDDDLMPAIDRLCRRAGKQPRDLRRIAVSIGPGGFTGLRIAVVTAKAIAEATGALCIPVPTALGVGRRIDPALGAGRAIAVCLAWKDADVWVERFEPTPSGHAPTSAGLMKINDLAQIAGSLLVADDEFVSILRQRGVLPHAARATAPVFDPAAILEAGAGLPDADPLALMPLYPREPEAVTKWRHLHSMKAHRAGHNP